MNEPPRLPLTWREVLASLLLLGAALLCLLLALRQPELGSTASMAGGGLLLVMAGWGVLRGIQRMRRAVRTMATVLAVMLLALLLWPMQGSHGEAVTVLQRLPIYGPPLLWCALVVVLLWPGAVRRLEAADA